MTTKEAPEAPERVTLTEPRSPADVFREPPGMVSQAKYDAKEAERAALETKLAEVHEALHVSPDEDLVATARQIRERLTEEARSAKERFDRLAEVPTQLDAERAKVAALAKERDELLAWQSAQREWEAVAVKVMATYEPLAKERNELRYAKAVMLARWQRTREASDKASAERDQAVRYLRSITTSDEWTPSYAYEVDTFLASLDANAEAGEASSTCSCRAIQAAEPHRHFKGCALRKEWGVRYITPVGKRGWCGNAGQGRPVSDGDGVYASREDAEALAVRMRSAMSGWQYEVCEYDRSSLDANAEAERARGKAMP